QIHRTRAERIVEATGHMARQIRPPPQHLRRRRPARPFLLRGDAVGSAPAEAVAADADAVAQRLTVGEHQIEPALGGVDVNRTRGVIAVKVNGRALDRAGPAIAAALEIGAATEDIEKGTFLGLRMADN